MPEYTGKNLNLVKPLMGDYVEQTIPQLAENMQKIDDEVTDLAGDGRTTETVKGNADAITALAGEGNTTTVKAVNDALTAHKSEDVHKLKLGIGAVNNDLNQCLTDGIYNFGPNAANRPFDDWGLLEVIVSSGITYNGVSNWIWQKAYQTNNKTMYIRRKINNGAWQPWIKILNQDNYDQLFQYANAVNDALTAHKSENASTTAKGHVQLATAEEAVAGIDTAKAVTPAGLKAALPVSLPANGGNADTAAKLLNARIIALSGDVSGNASFDGSANISISTVVADDSHNHVISNIDNLQTILDSKAPLASPAFTGTPTAPTAPNGTNTNQIATTKFVQNALSAGGHGDMLKSQYDTDSDGKVDAADSADSVPWSGIKDKPTTFSKTARFVVGTSTAGWTEEDCHYLCDGTNDQAEINAAIQALPANGGEIVILDGTYNITAEINVNKSNVSIRGNGNATILKRMWDSSSGEGVITLTSVEDCKIENLQIDGNKSVYSGLNNCGIYLYSSSNNTITGNICNNNSDGIDLLSSSSDNTVTGNTCNNNIYSGIRLSSSSSDNTVTGNTCNNNSHYGIWLYSSSNNNTIIGNACNNNNNCGIYLYSSSSNTIIGNACRNNSSSGIYLLSSNNNTITGNTCIRGTGQTSDYTSDQYTIHLSGTNNNYNLISSNNCMGKAVVVEGGTGNSTWGNKYDAGNDLP